MAGEPQGEAQTHVPASESDTGGALDQTDIDSLRRNHPVANEGAACGIDEHCDSPLRCIDNTCVFPPAMTGTFDGGTPRAIFYTEQGDHLFYLETAVSRAEMMRGLMHRRTLARDFGMIFIYPDARPRSFWMQNTLISLDIIYVDGAGRIDSIAEEAEPETTTSRRSDGPARYVIEIRGGLARSLGIRPGGRVELLNFPAAYLPQ